MNWFFEKEELQKHDDFELYEPSSHQLKKLLPLVRRTNWNIFAASSFSVIHRVHDKTSSENETDYELRIRFDSA